MTTDKRQFNRAISNRGQLYVKREQTINEINVSYVLINIHNLPPDYVTITVHATNVKRLGTSSRYVAIINLLC